MESWPVDLAIAMTHLILSAWNKGLGSVDGDFDEDKIREICNVPPSVRIAAVTPLGYPVKTVQQTSRRSLERINFSGKFF
jgi:nitroreductase